MNRIIIQAICDRNQGLHLHGCTCRVARARNRTRAQLKRCVFIGEHASCFAAAHVHLRHLHMRLILFFCKVLLWYSQTTRDQNTGERESTQQQREREKERNS